MGGWGGGKGWRTPFKVKAENAAATVWLGNLPEGIGHEEIKTNFEAAGTVKRVQLIKQGKEGFAWFSTPDEAQTAIGMFNGAQINGQAIVVDPWTKKAELAARLGSYNPLHFTLRSRYDHCQVL